MLKQFQMCEQTQGFLLPHQSAPCCVFPLWDGSTSVQVVTVQLPSLCTGGQYHWLETQPLYSCPSPATWWLIPRQHSHFLCQCFLDVGQAVAGHSPRSGCCVVMLGMALDLGGFGSGAGSCTRVLRPLCASWPSHWASNHPKQEPLSLLHVCDIQQLSAVACKSWEFEELVWRPMDYFQHFSGGAARRSRPVYATQVCVVFLFWAHAFFRKSLVACQSNMVKQSLLHCRNKAQW